MLAPVERDPQQKDGGTGGEREEREEREEGREGNEALLTLGTGGQWIIPETEFRPTDTTNLFRAIDTSGISYYRLAAAQNVAAGHRPERAILGGGGTDHPAWRRLLADVLGLPLLPAPTSWLSAAGAAMMAAEAATGGEPNGASRGRSGYGKEDVVTSGERTAASASYDRFLFFRRSWPTR
jgi:sugar (pentulose or hexulose) kinase